MGIVDLSCTVEDAMRPCVKRERPLLRGNPFLPLAKVPASPRPIERAMLLASYQLLIPLH
eukprot:6122682-Pyramimonas_sp.AAC.1